MAFDPSITSVYYPTPITVGDGTYRIQFTGVFGEPLQLPEIQYEVNLKPYYMRQGANQPGNRVFLARGAAVGYGDVEFVTTVTPTQYAQLTTWYMKDPGGSGYPGFAYSPDGGTTNYDCLWQKKGLTPENYEYNQRAFTKVTIKLHILGVSTTINLSEGTIVN